MVGGGPGEGIFTQVSSIAIDGGKYQCQDPAVICKSVNSDVLIDGAEIHSTCGVLAKSRINDDPCAPNPEGRDVYGIHVTLRNMNTENSILHEDTGRKMTLKLENTALVGAITGGVLLTLDADSRWTANGDSNVVLHGDLALRQIDALSGVTITAVGAEEKTVTLPSSGILVVKTA